ncbi:dihydrodipicolinate synthase family protein [Paenibacillus filicis]|uniref:Dihydrodipicolinate synthase family protein n=1 Tax=Paenibacillus filicis TaxID=669464 RepID=A0ABU9DFQ0_9BACL
MSTTLTGILPALVTPFDREGNLIHASAEKLLQKYKQEQADGLYMLGFTGEGSVMSVSERKAWTETVLSTNSGIIPVLVHVGYSTEEDALELAHHAVRHGATAVSSVPLSNSATLQQNTVYFKKLAEAAELPFYIYWNQEIIDERTGKRAAAEELVEAMSTVRNFAGIKYTDSNFYYLERIKNYNPDINILTGFDTAVIAGRLMGSDGAIGALQSVTCGHMKAMWDYYSAGNLAKAQELQFRANHLYEAIDRPEVGVIAGLKAILEHEGIPGLPKTPVQPVLDPAVRRELLDIYEQHIDNRLQPVT